MIKLTIEEKNALDVLTHRNKMDCWFWIDDENDCIRDLEDDNNILDTAAAVLEVIDGTPDIYELLDDDQAAVIVKLYDRIKEEENNMSETTSKDMIKAIVKEPGKAPEVREIENSLRGYQKLVEGYIESVPMPGKEDEMDLVMNDEGKMIGLSANIYVPEYRDIFVGTLVAVGVTTDLQWRGLTAEEIEYAKQYLAAHDCESGSTYVTQNQDKPMKGEIQEEIIRDKKHETAVYILDWLSDHKQAEEDLKAYLHRYGYDLRDIL